MGCVYVAAFNQTEAGRLQGGKGTGLGLALVRQIVKLSGGRLGLQSKVNEGSTFWVELREFSFLPSFPPFPTLSNIKISESKVLISIFLFPVM